MPPNENGTVDVAGPVVAVALIPPNENVELGLAAGAAVGAGATVPDDFGVSFSGLDIGDEIGVV